MLLGLDLATSTGFCFGDGLSTPVVGSERMPSTGEEVGPFLDHFDRWLRVKLETVRPDLVGFEAPILSGRGTHIMTSRKLQGLAGLVEMQCHRFGIEVQEVGLQTVKRELTGHGRAEKHQMKAAARAFGITLSEGHESEDEADAFGVWLVALRCNRPHLAGRWEPLFNLGET